MSVYKDHFEKLIKEDPRLDHNCVDKFTNELTGEESYYFDETETAWKYYTKALIKKDEEIQWMYDQFNRQESDLHTYCMENNQLKEELKLERFTVDAIKRQCSLDNRESCDIDDLCNEAINSRKVQLD